MIMFDLDPDMNSVSIISISLIRKLSNNFYLHHDGSYFIRKLPWQPGCKQINIDVT